jgi:hypothetical protein
VKETTLTLPNNRSQLFQFLPDDRDDAFPRNVGYYNREPHGVISQKMAFFRTVDWGLQKAFPGSEEKRKENYFFHKH